MIDRDAFVPVHLGDIVPLRLPPTAACTHLGVGGQVWLVLVLPGCAQLLTSSWKRTHQIIHADAGLITETGRSPVFTAAVQPGGPAKVTEVDFTSRTDIRPQVWRRNPSRIITRAQITWSLHRDNAGHWLLREHDGRIHVSPDGRQFPADAAAVAEYNAQMDAIERGQAY